MKAFRKMKRPLAAAALCLTMFQFSAQQAVAVGNYAQARAYNADQTHVESALGWAAIAAGVAVAGAAAGAVVAAYEVGTIVGRAAADLFGKQQHQAVAFERAAYAADDFSQFDTPTLN